MVREHSISIIIISRKRSKNLRRVLESLCYQTSPAKDIIVIHIGSNATPGHIIKIFQKRLPIKYITAPDKNSASALNRGVAVSSGSILAFLGDDCVPRGNWTEVITREFSQRPETVVLQGNTLLADKHTALFDAVHRIESTRWMREMLAETPGFVRTLSAENFAIRGDLIRRFRMPFDERLDTNEDVEFYWKLNHEKVPVAFSQDMVVIHHPTRGLASSLDFWYRYGVGKGQLKRIHDDFWDYFFVPVESPAAVFSWFFKELTSTRLRKYFITLVKGGSLLHAVGLYPAALMQRTSLVRGLMHGIRRRVPAYNHPVTPLDLVLFVTNKCNLRCKHCFYHAGLSNPGQDISASNMAKIIKSLNRDLRTVNLVGGEPFLHNELEKICEAFSELIHVKNMYIITNGFYPSRIASVCEKILEKAHFNLYVRVSIDGLSETHNRLRKNRRSFQNAVETIRRLHVLAQRESRLQVEIQTTINSGNFNELESMAKFFAQELDVFPAFDITRNAGMGLQNPDFILPAFGPEDPSTGLTPDQLGMVEQHVKTVYEKHYSNRHFSRHQIDYQVFLIGVSSHVSLHKKLTLPCTAGDSMVTIYPDYDVAVCDQTRPIGNLKAYNFDLNHLLEECFTNRIRNYRDDCYCTNPCFISSGYQTAQEHVSHRKLHDLSAFRKNSTD